MALSVSASRLPEVLGDVIARLFGWSPLDREVTILIEISEDPYLVGRVIAGTVRARDDRSGGLLIQMEELLPRRKEDCFFDLVVASPVLRWHGPNRLLVTWTAVRFIDACSFAAEVDQRTIATGRLLLRRQTKRR